MLEGWRELIKRVDLSWRAAGSELREAGILAAFLAGLREFLSQESVPRVERETGGRHLPAQVRECFDAFCDGVDYIDAKYGTRPNAVILTEEESNTPRYNIESGNVYVPLRFLEGMSRCSAIWQSKTGDERLTPAAMATMYGVEEAFHHYQLTQQYEKYAPHLSRYAVPPAERGKEVVSGYDDNPIEQDAAREVQLALTAFRRIMPRQFASVPPGAHHKQHNRHR